jgi:hypothetical protein
MDPHAYTNSILARIAERRIKALFSELSLLGCSEPTVTLYKIGHYQVVMTTVLQMALRESTRILELLQSFWARDMPRYLTGDSINDALDVLSSDVEEQRQSIVKMQVFRALHDVLKDPCALPALGVLDVVPSVDSEKLLDALTRLTQWSIAYVCSPNHNLIDIERTAVTPVLSSRPRIPKGVTYSISTTSPAVVVQLWPTPVSYGSHLCVPTEVLTGCLGGLPTSAAMQSLRHEEGLTYTTGSTFSPAFGAIITHVVTNRREVSRAIQRLNDLLISPSSVIERASQAILYLLTQRRLVTHSPMAMILYHLERILYEVSPDPFCDAELIKRVTHADLQAAHEVALEGVWR